MKIQSQLNSTETNTTDATDFKIKSTARAFKILSDGLYSDKILAVIRELCCNAWDAHMAAGIPEVPFQITLPNHLEPHFSVKDFGIGLCHEDILHVYTTYFESTKSDSNDFIGALGLGSKSPFSYVDKFSVISIWNGLKSTYTAYIASNGAPSIVRMGDPTETDEGNGIEVTFPVKATDVNTFLSKAQIALRYFKVLPTVKGVHHFDLPRYDFQREEDDWKMFTARNKSYAVQGNVGYPLDIDSIKSFLSPEELMVAYLPLQIEFQIGELESAASREGLSYEENTVANIKKRLRKIYDVLIDECKDFYKDCKTEYEARLLFFKIFGTTMNYSNSTTGSISEMKEFYRRCVVSKVLKLEWKGKTISSNLMEFEPAKYPNLDFDLSYARLRKFRSVEETHLKAMYKTSMKPIGIYVTGKSHPMYFDDLPKSGSTRLYAKLGESGSRYGKEVLFIKPRKSSKSKVSDAEMSLAKKDLEKFLIDLDGIPQMLTSSIPATPKEVSVKSEIYEILAWKGFTNSSHTYGSSCWNKASPNVLNKALGVPSIKYYVPVYEYGVVSTLDFVGTVNSSKYKIDRFDQLVAAILHRPELFNISKLPAVYGLRKKDLGITKDDPTWVNLIDHIEKTLKDKNTSVELKKEITSYLEFSFLESNKTLKPYFEDEKAIMALPDNELKRLALRTKSLRDIQKKYAPTSTILTGFGIIKKLYKIAISDLHGESIESLHNKVLNKYPMLGLVSINKDSYDSNKVVGAINSYVSAVDHMSNP